MVNTVVEESGPGKDPHCHDLEAAKVIAGVVRVVGEDPLVCTRVNCEKSVSHSNDDPLKSTVCGALHDETLCESCVRSNYSGICMVTWSAHIEGMHSPNEV